MDSISQLPDALLLRILSFLPAEDVVATMVLSKRWQPVWALVPKLVYDYSYQSIDYGRFTRFVDRSLLLHEAPVLDVLHFKLGQNCVADIGVWFRSVTKRCVHELIIEIDSSYSTTPVTLPRSLYTVCSILVTLKLNSMIFVDSLVSFPSLKTLSFVSVKFPDDEFFKNLLSNCPVLEDLVVERSPDDNMTIVNIIVPSLKRLVLRNSSDSDEDDARGFVIDAPTLEFFDIVDYNSEFCVFENYMPNIVKAHVDVLRIHPGKILSSITSVKRLYLGLSLWKDVYPVGTIFNRLLHLRLRSCEKEWLNLLMCMLRDSPNLKSLVLASPNDRVDEEQRPLWNEPSSVPKCLLSSLQTFGWVGYGGTEEELQVATFILRNSGHLERAVIFYNSINPEESLEMLRQLSMSPRSSSICRLKFI